MGGLAPSPASEAIKFVRQLSKHPATSPFPLISELRLVALAYGLKERSTQWLIQRWHELRERECSLEAHENMESMSIIGGQPYRDALLAEAEAQIELAAIDAVLEGKKINPREYRGDGFRLVRP